jgi:hypothetical protein
MSAEAKKVDPFHTKSMAEVVAGLSKETQQLYADYMLVLNDDSTPGYDDRLRKLRHAAVEAMNFELLNAELASHEK